MTDLYPTPSRLALLEGVANGEVYRSDWLRYDCYWDRRTVTSRCKDVERAGWIELLPRIEATMPSFIAFR